MTSVGSTSSGGRRPVVIERMDNDHTGLSPRPVTALIVVIIAVGALLRFVAVSPLWLDEALSVNLASLPVGDLPGALRHDGHPALYYLILGRWIDVFGDGDSAARALSALFSIATVPVMWAATRRRFGSTTARHAAILGATSPFLIRYATETRMYAMVAFGVAVAWWALDALLEAPRWSRGVILAAATAGLVHTHYWTIWLVAAVVALLAVHWSRDDSVRPRVGRALIAILAGAATFVFWLPVFFDQLLHTGTPWADRARPAEVAVETVQAIGGGNRFEGVFVGIVLVLAVVIGATVVGRGAHGILLSSPLRTPAGPVVAVVVLSLGLGGAVALATGGAFEGRYAAIVVPMILALAARATAGMTRAVGTGALIGLAVLGVVVAADEARRDRTQGADVAAIIDSLAEPGDTVVVCPDQLAPATVRSLDHPGSVVTYPPVTDLRLVDWYDYSDRIAAADPEQFAIDVDSRAARSSVWLVMMTSYRGFEGRCETISAVLGRSRASSTLLLGSRVYEPMFLQRFDPRSDPS